MEKIKNLPVMRVVAFAVAIAIVIGFSSVMFSVIASAESTNKDIKTGSFNVTGYYDGYPCINLGTDISFYDFVKDYNTFGYGFCVIPIVIKDNVTYFYKLNSSWDCYGYIDVYTSTTSNGGIIFNPGNGFLISSLSTDNGESYKNYKTVIKSSSSSSSGVIYNQFQYDSSKVSWVQTWNIDYDLHFYDYKTKTYASNVVPTDIKYVLVSNQSCFLQNKNRNNNWSDLDSIFSDNATFTEAGASPSAEFTNFKGTDEAEPYLFFVDWFDTGNRLPLADFRIDDNANYHSYSLRISTNKQYVETLKSVWAEQEVKEAISLSQSLIGNVCIPLNHSQLIKRVAQLVIIKKVGTFSYNVERNITSDLMRFDDSSNVNSKGISICLSDYVTIIPYCIYKLEIIDNNTSSILDTVYFNSENGYSKGNSGYGTKVNDYENKSDLDDDLKNNNGFTGGTSSNGDVMNIDDPADITDMDNIKAYGDLDITSIFNSLQSSSRALASFFQMCMNIIPAGILAIILGGLSIVIILRILGR